MIEIILSLGYILLMLSVAVGFSLHYKLLSLLKEKHPEKWKELGEPSLFLNNSMKNSIAVLNFLSKKEYLEMNDKQLTKLAGFLRIFYFIYMIFFLFLILLFVFIVNFKRP